MILNKSTSIFTPTTPPPRRAGSAAATSHYVVLDGLLIEMFITFEVSHCFFGAKKLIWMISCRLHPVLCIITFYGNDQGSEGGSFAVTC